MRSHATAALLCALLLSLHGPVAAQDFATLTRLYRSRLETNLTHNIAPFWHPETVDRQNGGYILNHDIGGRVRGPGMKMIVTQARMLWFFSRLHRAGYGGSNYLAAADTGYRFLKEKMWDKSHGGFYWQVDPTGDNVLRPKKHVYGQSFALFALSEYHLATGNRDALDLAIRLFELLESKAHDPSFGGYLEWFNADWSPAAENESSYMGEPAFKLMNTHLHLLESMTCFYRASRLPLARERLLELIAIQSSAVVRKNLGACTDKYRRNWQPVLGGNYARVSYGHDLENIWLLMDACEAARVSPWPYVDLYRALFDYALKYGFDEAQGGFYDSGSFNHTADQRDKTWWVQAEALVAALALHQLTQDPKYLRTFEKTLDWIDKHQVDWNRGEWFESVSPDGTPHGPKASPWKSGYHNGRAMIECLGRLTGEIRK